MTSELEKLRAENSRLKKTVEDLWMINHLARIIGSTMPVDQILDAVVESSLKAIGAEQGTISLLNEQKDGKPAEENDDAAFKTIIRRVDTSTPRAQLRLDAELSDWMIRNRKPLMINDVEHDRTFKALSLFGSDIRSVLSVPLLCKGSLIGVVNIFNKKDQANFNKDDQRLLSIIATQSAQTIENARLYEEEKQLRRYEHELDLARKIQHSLIPTQIPQPDGLEIASYFNPAHQVGGDYFDYFNLRDGQIGVVMADVSGHGASAALVMTMVKGIVHAITHAVESPAEVLTELNAILNEIRPNGTFVTMVFLVIDPTNRVLRFSNAGHNPLIHYQSRTKSCQQLKLLGPALSITDRAKYRVKEIPLQANDVVVIYTDGVTEAFNKQNQMFEERRLLEAVQDASGTAAEDVVERVKKRLQDFTLQAPQSDDIALIVMKSS